MTIDNQSSIQANEEDIINDKKGFLQKISQDSSNAKSGETNSNNFPTQKVLCSNYNNRKGSVYLSHVGGHRKRTGFKSPYFNNSHKSRLKTDSNFKTQLSCTDILSDHAYLTCNSKEAFAYSTIHFKTISRPQDTKPYPKHDLRISCDEKVVSGETGLVEDKFLRMVEWGGSAELAKSPFFALPSNMTALHLTNNVIGKRGALKFLNNETYSTLESADLFPEKLSTSYNRQGAHDVLQVSDNTMEESVCYKCGRITNDKQMFQKTYACSICASRRYSPTVTILDLKSTIPNHSSESNWCKQTSKCQYSCRDQKSYVSPSNLKAYYLESLGLVQQSEFFNDQANNKNDILCSKLRMPIGTFVNGVKCRIEAKKSQWYTSGFYSTDENEKHEHRRNTPVLANASRLSPFILHRRYGVQRAYSRNNKYLMKNRCISPYFYLGVKKQLVKLLKRKNKSYRKPHFISVKNGATLTKQTNNKESKNNLFQRPITFAESCMVDKNDEPGTSCRDLNEEKRSSFCHDDTKFDIERGGNVLFCDPNGTKVTNADCIPQRVNDEDTQRSYAFLSDDSIEGKQSDLLLCSETTSDSTIENNVEKHSSFDAETVYINRSKQANTNSLDVGTLKRQHDVYANGTKQLRGKHTIRLHVPPRSPYGLIQEQLYDNPWKMLIACLFLNRTTAKQVIPVIWKFFELWPDPETTMNADWHKIEGIFPSIYNMKENFIRIFQFDYYAMACSSFSKTRVSNL